MDPVCHTLFGAALARAGLRRGTPLATATLLIGANLPDVDAVVYLASRPALDLGFRRGWTHGIGALAVWPFVLTGVMLLWDRWVRRRVGTIPPPKLRPRRILALAFVSVWSHPILDTLNTYGVRWLMPFSGRWFYGDTLFIVDPWVWLALAAGTYLAARQDRIRRHGARPVNAARVALALMLVYVLGMAGMNLAGRAVARRELERGTGDTIRRLMAAPAPVSPFTRAVVAEGARAYYTGRVTWRPTPRFRLEERFPLPDTAGTAMRRALAAASGRDFLRWARFPLVQLDGATGAVRLVDLRYARPGDPEGFGTLTIRPGDAPAGPVSPAGPAPWPPTGNPGPDSGAARRARAR
ncbi:MAG TPA: metal-dependent hydrolase [Gemmatimonadales bacterium]|nr:metal-dependent hydrolase [Gemmatimonadales bacterium]